MPSKRTGFLAQNELVAGASCFPRRSLVVDLGHGLFASPTVQHHPGARSATPPHLRRGVPRVARRSRAARTTYPAGTGRTCGRWEKAVYCLRERHIADIQTGGPSEQNRYRPGRSRETLLAASGRVVADRVHFRHRPDCADAGTDRSVLRQRDLTRHYAGGLVALDGAGVGPGRQACGAPARGSDAGGWHRDLNRPGFAADHFRGACQPSPVPAGPWRNPGTGTDVPDFVRHAQPFLPALGRPVRGRQQVVWGGNGQLDRLRSQFRLPAGSGRFGSGWHFGQPGPDARPVEPPLAAARPAAKSGTPPKSRAPRS